MELLYLLYNPFAIRRVMLFVIIGFVALICLGFLVMEIKRNRYDPDK
jgi:hypothetical protein